MPNQIEKDENNHRPFSQTMTASTRRYFSTFVFCFLLNSFGNASRHVFPTPTLAGLRADAQFDILPTPNSWPPPRDGKSKRFAGDPAICGWVDGHKDDIVSCNSGYDCFAESTFVGCCTKSNFNSYCEDLKTTCYDSHSKSCDAACRSNSAALICEQGLYCGIYRYASGSRGYACAARTDYNETVLTTVLTVTSSSVVQPTPSPFGHDPSTTSTTSTSPTVEASSTTGTGLAATTSTASTSPTVEASSTTGTGLAASNSAAPVPVIQKSMSRGAIAGTVIGSVLGVVAILTIMWFLFQRYRKIQAKQRHGNQTSRGPYPLQDQRVYDQYGKLIYSPPWSPRSHSRHQSDVHSELDGVPVSPDPTHKSPLASPGMSEVDGSPETVRGTPLMSHEFLDAGQQNRPAELSGVD